LDGGNVVPGFRVVRLDVYGTIKGLERLLPGLLVNVTASQTKPDAVEKRVDLQGSLKTFSRFRELKQSTMRQKKKQQTKKHYKGKVRDVPDSF